MKTKIIFSFLFFLLIGGIYNDAMAQKNIAAVVSKCESIESVKMTIVRNKNKEKKTTQIITSIDIQDNPALVNEFLEAFRKDEPDAKQSIDTKKNGKIIPEFYSFDDVSYSFSMSDNGEASITVIEK